MKVFRTSPSSTFRHESKASKHERLFVLQVETNRNFPIPFPAPFGEPIGGMSSAL